MVLTRRDRSITVREAARPSTPTGRPAIATGTDRITGLAPRGPNPQPGRGRKTELASHIGGAAPRAGAEGVATWTEGRA